MYDWEAVDKRLAGMSESDPELKLIDKILDAAMAGDEVRLRELFHEHPHLGKEFEGINEGYDMFQAAMRSDPVWYEQECAAACHEIDEMIAEIQLEEKELIGSLTHATRTWPRPDVVRLYQSIAEFIVRTIGRQVGHEFDHNKDANDQDEIDRDGEFLCSPDVITKLRQIVSEGNHARDFVIEVLAKRWGDTRFVDHISREKLAAHLMKNARFRQQLAAWEDRMAQPI